MHPRETGAMFSPLFRFLPVVVFTPFVFAANFDRELIFAPHGGGAREDADIRAAQARTSASGAKAADFESLGWTFIAKARRTLDAGYYKLAEKTADVWDAQFGASPESRLLRGHVLHNVHCFREAETVARLLVIDRGRPEDLALLSDALMEQGKLAEAVDMLQRMVNLKPGVESYSRIAQLRWLKGDLAGATAAMEMAMRAVTPRDDAAAAWTLTRLSGFYLAAGRTDAALNAAEAAAQRVADFPPALLARGRVLLALGKIEAALDPLARAAALNPLPEYQWWLADAQRAAGRADAAAKTEAALRASGEGSDPRTFALFLATRRENLPTALRLAREERETRADVFTHDALAWAYAANGDFTAADTAMRAALAERTPDARLLWHAGEIALRRGARDEAEEFFRRARPLAATLSPSEHSRLTAATDKSLLTQNQQSHP